MRVEIQFFSRLKEVATDSTLERPFASGETVSDLLARLYRDFPALAKWDPHIRVAAGVEWVGREYGLRDGDRLSIMPPVQGG